MPTTTLSVRLRRSLLASALTVCALAVPCAAQQTPYFIENRGQWDAQASFLVRAPQLDLWITTTGVVYELSQENSVGGQPRAMDPVSSLHEQVRSVVDHARVTITFVGGHTDAVSIGENKIAGHHNYYIGNNPKRWATNVPLYSGVRVAGIYQGIDAVFTVVDGRPRYDMVVAPGADPGQIIMHIDGARSLSVGPNNSLRIETSLGTIEQRELLAYQVIDGQQRHVDCSFDISGSTVGFDLGDYDTAWPLVIDPIVYSTYLGGSSLDEAHEIAADRSGNAYITGFTRSIAFPTRNAFQPNDPPHDDAFITKLSSNGELEYSTYLGGNSNDQGRGIAVDAAGNAWVVGNAGSSDFPTKNALKPTGSFDGYVSKLTTSGTLIFSTYLGGSRTDGAMDVALDRSGNAYITGSTESIDFPVKDAYQATKSTSGTDGDVFVTKMTSNGAIDFSTFFGGTGSDGGYGICVDTSGNAYITGWTASTDFPTLNAAREGNGGLDDAFAFKLTSSGGLVYSTYLGGSARDYGNQIACDATGNAYLVGWTLSDDFPRRRAFQSTKGEWIDGFLTKLEADGALSYSTYIGASDYDCANSLVVDTAGFVYVAGYTASNDFPVLNAMQAAHAGGGDAYIMMFSPIGTLRYSTFFGGSANEIGQGTKTQGIAMDSGGNLYVAGSTTSEDFPRVLPAQVSYGGDRDAFVVKFSIDGDALVAQPFDRSSSLTIGVSPNPVSDRMMIDFELSEAAIITMQICGVDGRVVSTPIYSRPYQSGRQQTTIMTDELQPGTYFLRVLTKERTVVEKFIID